MKQFFETYSTILSNHNGEPDYERFMERICFEAYNAWEGTQYEYCEKLKMLMQNHIDAEEYEIAEGLKRAIKLIME